MGAAAVPADRTDTRNEPADHDAEIGDRLAELGDPRRGEYLDENGLPVIDWVEIPGGPFLYQAGETHELPMFWIWCYPITNAQFQALVDTGAYTTGTGLIAKVNTKIAQAIAPDIDGWQGLKKKKHRKSRWPQTNRIGLIG